MLPRDSLLRRTWLPGALGLVVGASWLLHSSSAVACSIAGVSPHEIRRDSPDEVAPGPVSLVTVDVADLGGGEGCGSESSCDGIGTVSIVVRASDDATAPSSMGFSIALVSGSLPAGLTLPDEPVRGWPQSDGSISLVLFWDPERADSMDFVVRVSAVDEAGNVGGSTDVPIASDEAHQGCSAGTAMAGGSWLVALLGALIVLGRGTARTGTPTPSRSVAGVRARL